jgi:hypothetical protein
MTQKTLLLLIVLASPACGQGSLGTGATGGTTAAGGTTATAGAGATGRGGSGGAGGASTQEARIPRCLADLVASCTCKVAGACGQQTCLADGVTTTTTQPDGGLCNEGGEAVETRVFKPDGSLCFSIRQSARPEFACETVNTSWWDATGQKVASASAGAGGIGSCSGMPTVVACEATGETGAAPIPWPSNHCPANACP